MEKTISGKPIILLLIEDNEDHAEVVKRSFKDYHVANEIHHVVDGESALDYLFRRGIYTDPKESPTPDLILLDLRLPKIDGLEVLKAIKEDKDLRKIPAVILTTSDMESDVAMAYDYHANSYLVKPLDFEKFIELMKEIGYYWLGWNTNPWKE